MAPAVLGSYCLSDAPEKKRLITYPIAFATMVLVSHICSKWVLNGVTFNKETYWFDFCALSFAAGSPNLTAFLLWRKSRPRPMSNSNGS